MIKPRIVLLICILEKKRRKTGVLVCHIGVFLILAIDANVRYFATFFANWLCISFFFCPWKKAIILWVYIFCPYGFAHILLWDLKWCKCFKWVFEHLSWYFELQNEQNCYALTLCVDAVYVFCMHLNNKIDSWDNVDSSNNYSKKKKHFKNCIINPSSQNCLIQKIHWYIEALLQLYEARVHIHFSKTKSTI